MANQFQPKVQTYIKDNQPGSYSRTVENPPEPFKGVRYAMIQGPSLVPRAPSQEAISTAVEFNLNTVSVGAEIASQFNTQMITLPELQMSGYEFGSVDDGGLNSAAAKTARATAEYLYENNYFAEGGPISVIAESNNVAIICPMPYSGPDPAGNEGYFDVAIVFGSTGERLGIQFKTHLWGTEEKTWFNTALFPATDNNATINTIGVNHDDFSPYAPFYINSFPVGVGICYDAEFPEVARCLALNGSLLSVFPTAAPNSILPGQTEPYPDISDHYIPNFALQNLNFTSYSNRAGNEMAVNSDGSQSFALQYSGNSVLCDPYGRRLVAPVGNEDAVLIADCVYCDYPPVLPDSDNFLINRRPELDGYLTNQTVSFPFGETYTYPDEPPQHQDPNAAATNQNSC